ncbi:aminotransferase class I/II-fold pyridoxal phosphate-dependent enzyme [Rhodobacteraceae bacterium 2CG4]|uniref:Aminotransferase class I/II-fold pyridoxal phosphate-dependent enzyme n=1 Tax=Halovulum marinum TaxID=2662447 RepID=A0A6L5Z3W5_9RHOB|nr:aminotransferase class I/II-fold pyridoxal phosphate-dependent enzyme [Halovulum marinum]MSU91207.1 aminotransferase class I/II-fold pyridoxal phosphate-dependent enzyme [Halovulum marinum]
MDIPRRFADLPEYAFPRLRALLGDRAPGGPEIAMSIGEPRHAFPDFVPEIIARHADEFSRYPPNDGTPGLRAAISDWLAGRYGIPAPDPDSRVLPLNGTREGLFNAALALCPEQKNGQRPIVLLPNPFYQCYAVAALAAGAEPVYVSATEATGFLPDFAGLPAQVLDRTAIVYMCSPSNPQGAVAPEAYWQDLLALAERHDFRVFADECYSEIYRDAPPPGVLQATHATGADPERVVAFHSLSKRSNLPGLRSGFALAGPTAASALKQLRNYAGAPLPLPLQHAAEAVWRDEDHVIANRAAYVRKFDLADQILGNIPGYRSPEAGFFLWLDVGDGEAAALRLWTQAGVRALPGAYLSRDPGDGSPNPGTRYLRVALVAAEDEVERGLKGVRAVLADRTPAGGTA